MIKLKMVMTNLKSQLKKLSLKKTLLLVGGGTIIIIIVYLLLALLTVDQAELKLAELKNSFLNEKICHEDCAKTRQQTVERIVNSLIADPNSRVSQRLKIYFLDQNSETQFKVELVRILSLAYGSDNPPDYLKEYLKDSTGNPTVQVGIINYFSSSLDYYFRILAGNNHLLLKEGVVKALSNYPDKQSNFSVGQLTIIKKVVLNLKTDNHLRASLILLLGDYYPLFPRETDSILKMVYSANDNNDDISRAFAVDILNRLVDAKLPIPEVSAAQWEEYYNN